MTTIDPNLSNSWYHGNIDRPTAERLLKAENLSQLATNSADQNVFLLRHSKKFETQPNTFSQYSLSVRFNNEQFKHYRLYFHNTPLSGYQAHETGFYIDTSQNHPSGYDFIGSAEVLEQSLKDGQIELEISPPGNTLAQDPNNSNNNSNNNNSNSSSNRRPFKCYPISPTYDRIAGDARKSEYHSMPHEAPPPRVHNKSTVQIKQIQFDEMRGWLSFSSKSPLSIFKDDRKWFYQLTNNELQWFLVNPDHNIGKAPTGSMSLNDILEVRSHPEKKNKFTLKLVNRSDQKYTCSEDKDSNLTGEQLRDKWCETIKQRIKYLQQGGRINSKL